MSPIRSLFALTLFFASTLAAGQLSRDEIISRCLNVARQDLEPCLIKLINELRPRFGEGLPEFGVPRTDLLDVGIFNFTDKDENDNNAFIDGSFYEIIIKGLDDMTLTKLKLDYDKHQAVIRLEFPDLFITGRYVLNASFVVIPLVGEGTFWIRLGNVVADAMVIFDFVLEDGDYRFTPKEIEHDFDYVTISMRLNNLFSGNAVLKEAADAVVQQNARELVTLVKPRLLMQIDQLIRDRSTEFGKSLKLSEMAGHKFIRKAFGIGNVKR